MAASLFAENESTGNDWVKWTTETKIVYVKAFLDGRKSVALQCLITDCKLPDFTKELGDVFGNETFTVVQICSKIDKYYAKPKNRATAVDIAWALSIRGMD